MRKNKSKLSTHCIFIDPPWGGYSYKNLSEINELYLDTVADMNDLGNHRTISLSSLCTELFDLGAQLIGIKLPLNFHHQIYTELFKKKSKKTNLFIWEKQLFYMIALPPKM